MSSTNKRNQRVDFRVSSEDKSKLLRAADFAKESMADFILNRIMPEVERIIAQEEKIRLSQQAWTGFVQLLETPRPASSSLKAAMQDYRKIQGV
jgi:uncharacterized protein (DUF1778 family)